MPANEILNHEEIELNLKKLPGWRHENAALHARISCGEAQQAIDLFAKIAQLAQAANHHPDVDWRYNKLLITLTSHDVGSKVTQRDVALAQEITREATEFQATID